MAYSSLNEQQLMHLERLASRGDDTALDILYQESKRIAKAANTRLLRIEKAGKTDVSQAYQKAEFDIEKMGYDNRFRVNKKQSIDDLVNNYRSMRSFMAKESSTIKGLKYAQERLIDTLEAYDIHIPKDNRDEFYRFIRSDTVQDIIEYIGEYDVVMDMIANNIGKIQGSFKQLEVEFNRVLAGDENFDEMLERQAKRYGSTYRELYERHSNREKARNKRRRRPN